MWTVRGQYPSGDVVETFATEEAAREAQRRHLEKRVPVATLGPTQPEVMVPTRCSFCGKDRGQVGGMVAGPSGAGVAICDQCVALCSQILASAPGGSLQARRR